ncbi:microtubule-associated protein tau [Toxorhynchites rutilus septentrionalis]|uniref:microtubule-associated protein tau n=1 Tax=Toxorhynchites rutilus septentrionalis TaxID=329112 RepID=UPI002478C84B|nr:microtubule-associated protein tau [Toxorhynchites rutilus septentrionalis]
MVGTYKFCDRGSRRVLVDREVGHLRSQYSLKRSFSGSWENSKNQAPLPPKPNFGSATSGSSVVPPPQSPSLVRQLYAKPIIAPQIPDLAIKQPATTGYHPVATYKSNPQTGQANPPYYQPGARQMMNQNGPGLQRPPNPPVPQQNMRPMAPPMNRPGAPVANRPPGPPASPAPGQFPNSPNMRPQMPSPQQPGMQRPPIAQNMRPALPQQVRAPSIIPQNARPPFSPQNSTAASNQPIRPAVPPVRPMNIGQQPQPQQAHINVQQNRPAPIPQQIINNRPPSIPFKSPLQNSNTNDQFGSERESPESRMQSDSNLGKIDSPKGSYLSTDDDEDVVIGKITPLASSRSPEGQNSPTSKTNPSIPFNRSDSQMSIPSRPPSGLGNYAKVSDTVLRNFSSPLQPPHSNEIVYKEKHLLSTEQKPFDGSSHIDRGKTPSPDQGMQGSAAQSESMSRMPSTENKPRKPCLELPSDRIQASNILSKTKQATPTTPGAERVTFVLPDQTISNQNIDTLRKTPVPTNVPKKPETETRGRSSFKNNPSMDQTYNHYDNQGDNDSGVDESTQEKERNGPGSPGSPLKSPSKIPSLRRPDSITPQTRSRSTSKQRLTAKTPETPSEPLIKKVPMNKIQVGATPSPNLKVVKSKIGSLENTSHKPGGGHVKIETKKLDIKAGSRIEAKNDTYVPKGGDKKIVTTKLQWSAKPKIGSLDNAHHKPGGGDRKIETLKTDFKERAKPKVGSKDNLGYQPGGGDVKIVNQKLDIKAESKVGSLENVKHKPGGGDKKIFDDKEYLKQIDHPVALTPPTQSPTPDDVSNSDASAPSFAQPTIY